MLVLSRRLGEKIYIGTNIVISVVDIQRGRIRLGVDAPRDVPILRDDAKDRHRATDDGPVSLED